MTNRTSVSSADFIRNIGYWQNEALRQPISITHHGRERLVLATPDAVAGPVSGQEASSSLSTLRADAAAVLENLDDGFLSFDTQLVVRNSNTAAEAFVGLSREDLRGVPMLQALPQPLSSVLADRVQRVMRARQAERFEVGALEGRYFSITVFPIGIGAAAVLRNVTEQHVLRQRLEDGDATQRAVHRHPRTAAIKLDMRARIESIDDTFCNWSGFGRADVVSHRIVDLVSAPQRREVADIVERVLRESQAREIELTLVGKRGHEIAGVLALAPILTDFAAHGAFALFVPSADASKAQQAA